MLAIFVVGNIPAIVVAFILVMSAAVAVPPVRVFVELLPRMVFAVFPIGIVIAVIASVTALIVIFLMAILTVP